MLMLRLTVYAKWVVNNTLSHYHIIARIKKTVGINHCNKSKQVRQKSPVRIAILTYIHNTNASLHMLIDSVLLFSFIQYIFEDNLLVLLSTAPTDKYSVAWLGCLQLKSYTNTPYSSKPKHHFYLDGMFYLLIVLKCMDIKVQWTLFSKTVNKQPQFSLRWYGWSHNCSSWYITVHTISLEPVVRDLRASVMCCATQYSYIKLAMLNTNKSWYAWDVDQNQKMR